MKRTKPLTKKLFIEELERPASADIDLGTQVVRSPWPLKNKPPLTTYQFGEED